MVRCFIGVLLPQYLKTRIVDLEGKLQQIDMEAKFVEPENLHISVCFIGEAEEADIKKISDALDEICKRYRKLEVAVSGIKLIPNTSFIRVLALDVHDGVLKAISNDISREIGGDAKPPHVTICRVKKIRDKNTLLEYIRNLDSNVGKFEISSISLIKSELQKSGPVYTILHKSKLLENV